MIISMIAALGQRREIGKDNQLLWKLPNDMKWFVQNTKGKPIIMGRKTFESFGGRPLPKRINVVITRDENYQAEGAVVVHNIDDALAAVADAEEVMIIGGASFYEQMLPQAKRMYLTFVEAEFEADSWFPQWNPAEWREVFRESHPADAEHAFAYTFTTLERIN